MFDIMPGSSSSARRMFPLCTPPALSRTVECEMAVSPYLDRLCDHAAKHCDAHMAWCAGCEVQAEERGGVRLATGPSACLAVGSEGGKYSSTAAAAAAQSPPEAGSAAAAITSSTA